MVVRPNGMAELSPRHSLTQFALGLHGDAVGRLPVCARHQHLAGFGARVGFVAMLGLFPTLRVDLPQWNWYGFPTAYTAAQLVMHLVGFAAGGLVLARLIGGQSPTASGARSSPAPH